MTECDLEKAVSMPVVLTASTEDQVQGPLLSELAQILPEAFAQRVKRPGIINAMHHEGFNKAVKATDRKRPLVAGITTEVCVLTPGSHSRGLRRWSYTTWLKTAR